MRALHTRWVTTWPHWSFWLCSKALLLWRPQFLPAPPRVPPLLAEDTQQQRTGAEPGIYSDLFLMVSLASCLSLHSPHRLLSLRTWVLSKLLLISGPLFLLLYNGYNENPAQVIVRITGEEMKGSEVLHVMPGSCER